MVVLMTSLFFFFHSVCESTTITDLPDVHKIIKTDGETLLIPEGTVGVVLSGNYGRTSKWTDVTERINGLVQNGGVEIGVSPQNMTPDGWGHSHVENSLIIVFSSLHSCPLVVALQLLSCDVDIESPEHPASGEYFPKGVIHNSVLYVSESGYSVRATSEGCWSLCCPLGNPVCVSREKHNGFHPSCFSNWISVNNDCSELIIAPKLNYDEIRNCYSERQVFLKNRSSAQSDSMRRLAQPKTKYEKYSGKTQHRSTATHGTQQGTMATVFPEGVLPSIKPPLSKRGWQYMITPSNCLQPNNGQSSLIWLYLCVDLTSQGEKAPGKTKEGPELMRLSLERGKRIIMKMLLSRGVKPVVRKGDSGEPTTRSDVKSMLQSKQKYALLVDLVTTRRYIYTGNPHTMSNRLYRFIEERYPVMVKFSFIGITDNTSKRVARDMFFKGILPIEHGGSGKSSGIPHSFEGVDNEHQYAANPHTFWERDYIVAQGEEKRKLRERVRVERYVTGKYTPPAAPVWAAEHSQAQFATMSTRDPLLDVFTPTCERCWANSTLNTTRSLNNRKIKQCESEVDSLSDKTITPPVFECDIFTPEPLETEFLCRDSCDSVLDPKSRVASLRQSMANATQSLVNISRYRKSEAARSRHQRALDMIRWPQELLNRIVEKTITKPTPQIPATKPLKVKPVEQEQDE